jgi:hypothetical protein
MKTRVVTWAAVALLGGAGLAVASPVSAISPLTLPLSDPAGIGAPAPSEYPGEGTPFASLVIVPRGDTRSDYTHFRPRQRGMYQSSAPRPETFSQLSLGFFDPEGNESAGVLFGFRGGLAVDRNIQIGGQIDWRHHGNSETAVVSEGPGPGGTVITTRADLSRSSSDLVPMMGFIQVSADDLPVIPYFGVGAGLEVLHLSAENFQTGQDFNGTFAGFGWQIWGGAALPLSGRARLTSEVFVNTSELSRDVDDPSTGQTFRETVNMDGTGMRVGLAWGF